MRNLLVATMVALSGVACSHPNDTLACRGWQANYKVAEVQPKTVSAAIQADLLKQRPSGCQIP